MDELEIGPCLGMEHGFLAGERLVFIHVPKADGSSLANYRSANNKRRGVDDVRK